MGGSKGNEVTDDQGNRFLVTVAELQSLFMANLTRSEVDEFAGELIIWAEFHKEPVYV